MHGAKYCRFPTSPMVDGGVWSYRGLENRIWWWWWWCSSTVQHGGTPGDYCRSRRERHGCADLSSRAGDVTLRTSGRWGTLFSHGGDTLMMPAKRKKSVFGECSNWRFAQKFVLMMTQSISNKNKVILTQNINQKKHVSNS